MNEWTNIASQRMNEWKEDYPKQCVRGDGNDDDDDGTRFFQPTYFPFHSIHWFVLAGRFTRFNSHFTAIVVLLYFLNLLSNYFGF